MASSKKPNLSVNEFNQTMKPVSLYADAWKRLRRNKMALVSLWIVAFYVILTLSSPILIWAKMLNPHTDQIMDHVSLPPSFRPAGELAIEKVQARITQLEAAIAAQGAVVDSGAGFDASTGFDFGGPDPTVDPTAEPSADTGSGSDSGYDASTGFDFGGPDPTLDPTADATDTASAEETPAPASDDGFSGYGNPLKNELTQKQGELVALKEALLNDPLQKKVYIMGTDELGRDMLSRAIYGGRISIMIGLVGTLTAVIIGLFIGAIAGYVGGMLDNLIMRFVDIMYGLPYILLVIIFMAIVGQQARGSFIILFMALALVSWLTICRVVRGQIISLKNAEFVDAARSMGASSGRIIFRHLLPNTLGVVIVYSSLMIPGFIMNEAFISFLGLGVSAPEASWGTLVAEGVIGMESRPWQLLVPAVAMSIFLFCMNFLGDGLRDALDPQSKNRT